MKQVSLVAMVSLAAVLTVLPSGFAAAQESPAARIRALTGAPTRIAWIRGSNGKGAAFGPDEHLGDPAVYRVVALDTEDGGRERYLVPDPGTHSRPLITPSGKRVIWSDMEGNISIIDWDGRNRKVLLPRLGYACAVGVAEDPPGTEWVYVGEGRAAEGFNTIFRYPIDNPSKKEVVWDKTPSIDSWGFTRDGKSGASRFPSNVGSVTLPNGELKLVGQIGCTPDLSGDGAFVSHMQVITHAGVYIYNRDGSSRRFIDFRQGPPSEGLGPGEFWWTHFAHYDSRFITFAGPFRKLVGFPGNIYVCQLNEKRDAITTWVRVTHDAEVNTHPYVWMASKGSSAAAHISSGLTVKFYGGFLKRLDLPGPVKPVLEELRRIAENAKEADKAAEAKAIIAHVEAWAKRELERAKELETQVPTDAEKAYKDLLVRFSGLEPAKTAQERLQDKTFQDDLKSWALVEKMKAAEKRFKDVPGAERSAKDLKFARQNAVTISQIKTAAQTLGQQGASPWIVDEANAVLQRCGIEPNIEKRAATAPTGTEG